MKSLLRQTIFNNTIVSALLLCLAISSSGQSTKLLREFEISVATSPFQRVFLNKSELTIWKRAGLAKDKDSMLFKIELEPTDTLKLINLLSEINLDSLKPYYQNRCVDDGFQFNIILKKGTDVKNIILANYYQEDIGRIIYFINSIVPNKYNIWYDKKTLNRDYNNCINRY